MEDRREHWGWCATCRRSFFVGSSTDADAPSSRVVCPVCLEPPAEIRIAEPTRARRTSSGPPDEIHLPEPVTTHDDLDRP